MRAKLLGATVAALCVLGVFAASVRVADVAWRLQQDGVAQVSPVARLEGEGIAALMGVAPGSTEHRRHEAYVRDLTRKFGEHPGMTMLHMIPGALILALAPWQFSSAIRRRHPAVHRWSGRTLLVLAFAAAASAAFFGLGMPLGGAWEASATAIFGAFFLFAGTRGWIAIRAGDVARHREWMTRMFATALGIAVMRALGMAFVAATGDVASLISPAGFGITMWVGWIVTLVAAEVHIRSSRRAEGGTSAALVDVRPEAVR
jgi:uncharacterized membrane protein